MNGGRAYGGAVRAFAVLFIAIGAILLVRTLVEGGGPLSTGVLLGVAFLAVGVARLWLQSKVGR